MNKPDFILILLAVVICFSSYMQGINRGEEEQQKTIETEIYKRCLDSDIYNEFQCYNMIIKGE